MRATAETKARETYKKMCEEARKVNYQYEVMIEYESKLPKITPAITSGSKSDGEGSPQAVTTDPEEKDEEVDR